MIATLQLYIGKQLMDTRTLVMPDRPASVDWQFFAQVREEEINRESADLFIEYSRAAVYGGHMYIHVTFQSNFPEPALSTFVDIKKIQ